MKKLIPGGWFTSECFIGGEALYKGMDIYSKLLLEFAIQSYCNLGSMTLIFKLNVQKLGNRPVERYVLINIFLNEHLKV